MFRYCSTSIYPSHHVCIVNICGNVDVGVGFGTHVDNGLHVTIVLQVGLDFGFETRVMNAVFHGLFVAVC